MISAQVAYAVVDPNKAERLQLAGMIRQIDAKAEIRAFQNVADFITTMSDAVLMKRLKGVFVKLDQNLEVIQNLASQIREINPETYIIVGAPAVDMDTLKRLIQKGISQILVGPYDESALKSKMKSAEIFQKKVCDEAKALPPGVGFQTWQESFTDDVSTVALAGWLGDGHELPKMKSKQPNAVLLVNCEGLKGMSSVGIRAWLIWMKELQSSGYTQLIFRNLHPFFLAHVRMISGLIPVTGSIESFYLNYYNEETDTEKEFKFSQGEHFDSEKMQLPSKITALHDGRRLIFDLDQHVKESLGFYKGKIVFLERVVSR